MIGEARFHRGANPEGLMDSADGELLGKARILLNQPWGYEWPLPGAGGCFQGQLEEGSKRIQNAPPSQLLPPGRAGRGRVGQSPLAPARLHHFGAGKVGAQFGAHLFQNSS